MAKIFESPDGGHTIYIRERGSSERSLYSIDDMALDGFNKNEWSQIWWERNNNPALKKAIEQIIILYRLTKNEQSKR